MVAKKVVVRLESEVTPEVVPVEAPGSMAGEPVVQFVRSPVEKSPLVTALRVGTAGGWC